MRRLVRLSLLAAVVAIVIAAFAIPLWAAGGGGRVERARDANGSSSAIVPASSPGIDEIAVSGP